MMKIQMIKDLVEKLNRHRNEYYNDAKPSISDEKYDELFDELSNLEKETGFVMSNSPTCTVGYEVKSSLDKTMHASPLLSLEKTKSMDDLLSFCGEHELDLMLKMDGLTVKLEYEGGKLQMASTRGDGEEGEVITHNISAFKNVPLEITYKEKLVTSGEAFIHIDDFEKINESLSEDEKYSTPRNLAAGSARCLDAEVCSERNLYFVAFNVLEGLDDLADYPNSKSSKLEKLAELGFEICEFSYFEKVKDLAELESRIEYLKEFAKSKFLPIDGIVATYDDIKYSKSLGHTGHHYKDGLAFKFEDEKYETILRKIEWNPTRKGSIAPVAIFDTVVIDGCDISRATLNNISFIKKMNLNIDCRILISKRNMIIPCVEENLDNDKGIASIPEKCPCCGKETHIKESVKEGKTTEILCCSNSECLAQKIKKFVHFVGKPAMNIEGLSEATIEKFIQRNFLNSFSDFFHLDNYQVEIEEMDGFGEKSYQNLWDSIQKSKKITFEKFLVSIDIPKVGKTASKLISKEFSGDIEKFEDAVSDTEDPFDFTIIEDIGQTINDSIYEWFGNISNTNSWFDLKKEVEIQLPASSGTASTTTSSSGGFSGKTIVVTGKVEGLTRSDMEGVIGRIGAFSGSSISRSTDLLVIGAKPGATKLKKARDYGVPTMSSEDFLTAIGR